MASAPAPITNDRQLIEHLQLSAPEVRMLLGTSRFVLSGESQVSKSSLHPANDRLSIVNIMALVTGAADFDKAFDPDPIRQYVENTRGDEAGTNIHTNLMWLLDNQLKEINYRELDAQGASVIVFLMPAFEHFKAKYDDVGTNMLYAASVINIQIRENQSPIYLISTTEMQAYMAGAWLGINNDQKGINNDQNCLGRDLADHHPPTILIYRGADDELGVYTLTTRGPFKEQILSGSQIDLWRNALPIEISEKMQPEASAERPTTEGGSPSAEGVNPKGPTG